MTQTTQKLMQLFSQINHQPLMAKRTRHHHGDSIKSGRGPQRLLRLLSHNDGLTNAEIAELLDIRPSSVSAGIKQLEANQLAVRQTSPVDKRVSSVHLTAKGQQLMNDWQNIHNEVTEKIFANLSETEQTELVTLLTKMNVNLEQLETTEDPELQHLHQQIHDLTVQMGENNQQHRDHCK